jgi:hypothetical protein
MFLKNIKNLFFLYKFKKASAVDETRQISKLIEGQHMWKVSHETGHWLSRKICLKLATHKVNARYKDLQSRQGTIFSVL